MADASLARRYARALLMLGEEGNLVDRFGADLDAFTSVLALNDGQLRVALSNPALTVPERKGVISAILQRLGLHPMTNNFIQLLADKNRLSSFDEVRAAYQQMADARAGRVRGTVTTALPLDEAASAQIRSTLSQATGKTVLVDFRVDPALIGGIVAQVGDTVYDASIRSRLLDIQAELSQ